MKGVNETFRLIYGDLKRFVPLGLYTHSEQIIHRWCMRRRSLRDIDTISDTINYEKLVDDLNFLIFFIEIAYVWP